MVPAMMKTAKYDPYHAKLIPSAVQEHHTRQVLSLKPVALSNRSVQGLNNHTAGMRASQGHGRGQEKGLSHMLTGRDVTKGPLLKQADNTFAALNSKLGLP